MRDIMLIVHFIGLAMGLGTSIAFMIFGIASSKMEKEEGQKFIVNAFTLSKMGNIGIVLLIISGGYLITPYWPILTSMPFSRTLPRIAADEGRRAYVEKRNNFV